MNRHGLLLLGLGLRTRAESQTPAGHFNPEGSMFRLPARGAIFQAGARDDTELVRAWLFIRTLRCSKEISFCFTSGCAYQFLFHGPLFFPAQQGSNYVCCCKRRPLTTGTGQRKRHPALKAISSPGFFLTRGNRRRWRSIIQLLNVCLCVYLSPSVTHLALRFDSLKFPAVKPFYHPR